MAFLLLFPYWNLFSQVDSTLPNFFPHHLGDVWVYYVHNGVGDDTLQAIIISDSTDNIGNAYLHYASATRKQNDPPAYYWNEYQKIDTGGNVFIRNGTTYSRLQFKAEAQLGESWWTGYDTAFVNQISEGSVFSVPATIRRIGHKVGTEGYGESYAAGFGIISRTGSYAILGELYLIATKIGGVQYGDTTLTSVPKSQFQNAPVIFQLYPNYPNPFNGNTIIEYILTEQGEIKLTVYDLLGRQVRTLVDSYQAIGNHSVSFKSINLSSGIYFYELETKQMHTVRKMVLQK